jgi:hypothetical protein
MPASPRNPAMKIDLDSEEIARIVKALEHYHAYLRSQQQDERGAYLRLAERLRHLIREHIAEKVSHA